MDQDKTVTLRIVLKAPTVGAFGGVQTGSGSAGTVKTWRQMEAAEEEFTVEVTAKGGRLPLGGPAVQKDAKGRFVYIVWRGGEISRRAKVYIESVTQAMVDTGRPLTVVLPGQARDGFPCCATVKPLTDWQ
ncbi:MAG: hypothetical protein KF857_06395 [Fimbriimonadaceae bacterium]|nr:hypothetical protein [Fimbriimonadaceae bacterium]